MAPGKLSPKKNRILAVLIFLGAVLILKTSHVFNYFHPFAVQLINGVDLSEFDRKYRYNELKEGNEFRAGFLYAPSSGRSAEEATAYYVPDPAFDTYYLTDDEAEKLDSLLSGYEFTYMIFNPGLKLDYSSDLSFCSPISERKPLHITRHNNGILTCGIGSVSLLDNCITLGKPVAKLDDPDSDTNAPDIDWNRCSMGYCNKDPELYKKMTELIEEIMKKAVQ